MDAQKKDSSEIGETRHLRVSADLADMAGWIVEIEGGTIASFLDPIVRPPIETLYHQLLPVINSMKKAREKATQEAARLKKAREDKPAS